MRNLWLVTKREFSSRIRSGAYIGSTVVLMLLLFASTILPTYFENSSKSKPLEVTVLDKTGKLFGPLQQAISAMPAELKAKREVKLTEGKGEEQPLIDQARKGEFALLVIEGTFPGQLKARYLAAQLNALSDSPMVTGPLESVVRSARITERGLSPDVALEIMKPLAIEEKQLTKGDQERSQEQFLGTLMLAMGAIMSVYLITLMNAQFVFQGVLEEKVSRVVEVMAAAVRPTEMMVGKVIGLGALGMVQYVLMMGAWMVGNRFSSQLTNTPTQSLTLDVALLILVFVLLSYILNATLFAALGATISRMEDSQTILMPVSMVLAIPMFLITPVMEDPNSTLSVVFSFIPIFTPVIMLMRVMMGDVPAWQVWASIGLLMATTALVAWASGRIYRAALLTFGTRPSMKQIWQYLRAG